MTSTSGFTDRDAALIADADRRAAAYTASLPTRRVFPDAAAIAALSAFDADLADATTDAATILQRLDGAGSPATTASAGGRYFGFVIGGTLPVAAAAERLALAWDQCASSRINSPAAAAIESAAARLLLQALRLPADCAVGFGTSATAGTLAALATARRALLARAGWDFDADGLVGSPEIRVVVSSMVHVTVLKALRILGFGDRRIIRAPCDAHARIDVASLPPLDDRTILCLQAGEVNTGEFDPFEPLIARARAAGAWVHVDGAFGLWARAGRATRALADGVEAADSWTTDGHKWLNTPYDGAMTICRDAAAMAAAMNADAAYATAEPTAQKNLTLEFSRRARGVAIWAALAHLGREGVASLVERCCAHARTLADAARAAGLEVCNRVVLNQVLVRAADDAATARVLAAIQDGGEIWCSGTRWQQRPAFRLSVSSWCTTDDDIARAITVLHRAASV